jgi:hypothetical protein
MTTYLLCNINSNIITMRAGIKKIIGLVVLGALVLASFIA